MEVAILLALILLNGAFAMSEIALVTTRKASLRPRAEQGDPGAAAALRLGEEPTRFLSTVQVGITLIGVLSGVVGESALAPPFAAWLGERGMADAAAAYVASGVVVALITYFTIVLGELVPKRLGQLNPESVALRVARPMEWLAIASKPVVRLLSGSTSLVLRLLGARDVPARAVTEEEIRALLAEGSHAGVIELEEHQMVRNVFRLDDRQIGSLMVPRSEVIYLDIALPWEENRERILQSGHSRFPVVRKGAANILGVTSARRLLKKTLVGDVPDLAADLQPPVFVPENLTGLELLQNFRTSGVQLMFVIDEYGDVLGIVTLRDLLEAITGEMSPRDAQDHWAVQRDDGSWLLDGLIPVPELKDRLALEALPEEQRYHTLSGMLMLLLGRLPQTADRVEHGGWRFEVVDIDGKRVDKVLAVPLDASVSRTGTPGAAPGS
jgi:putative hemolysin